MFQAHSETHTHTQVLHGVPHVWERPITVSGGSFTCCNRVSMSRLQEMGEGEACRFPPNRMSCSALCIQVHVTPGYVWRPPWWSMRTVLRISDLLSWAEVELFSADWVICLAVYFPQLVFVQHRRAKPKPQRRSGHAPACGLSVFSILLLPAFLKTLFSAQFLRRKLQFLTPGFIFFPALIRGRAVSLNVARVLIKPAYFFHSTYQRAKGPILRGGKWELAAGCFHPNCVANWILKMGYQ